MSKLSILICSLNTRFLNLYYLVEKLDKQIDGRDIEILWLGDNKRMTTGEKREKLINIATGDYVSFIDDDDDISYDYINEFLKAIESNPDVVTFKCEYKNKDTGQVVNIDFGMDYINEDIRDIAYRMPYPICFIKRDIASKIPFPKQNLGEDSVFSRLLFESCLLQKEVKINKVLYYYNHNPKISTCSNTKYVPLKNKIDVVIVSDGRLKKNELLTQQCVFSLHGEIVSTVVEKHPKLVYGWSNTIRQKGNFNLDRFYNEGAKQSKSPVIIFCRNDIVFPANFVHDISKLIQGYDMITFQNKNVLCLTREVWNRIKGVENIKNHDLKELKTRIQINNAPSGV